MLLSTSVPNGRLSSQWHLKEDSPSLAENMSGWGKDYQAPRDTPQKMGSYPHPYQQHASSSSSGPGGSAVVPAASWDSSMPAVAPSMAAYHHAGQAAADDVVEGSMGNEHYRSLSGPAAPFSKTHGQSSYPGHAMQPPSPVSYSAGGLSQGGIAHPSHGGGFGPSQQQYAQQHYFMPSGGAAALADSQSSTSPYPMHDRDVHGYGSGMGSHQVSHYGYSSSAPVAGPIHYHPIPSAQHHHYPQHYPSSSPSFSDQHEFNPQLNPFEVKHRRRTTRSQFKLLESTFRENPKPNATVRKDISEQLDMPIRAVQIWFQNRRAKAKAIAKRDSSSRNMSNDGSFQEEDADTSRMSSSHHSGSTRDLSSITDDGEQQKLMYSPSHSRSHPSMQEAGNSSNLGLNASHSQGHLGTFKMPVRPLRVDTDSSGRRVTSGSMPSSAGFVYNTSPSPSSTGLGIPMYPTSHPTSTASSSSYEGGGAATTRPTSSSVSSVTTSASFDERYRRGMVSSPPAMGHDSSHVSGAGPSGSTVDRQLHQSAGQTSSGLPVAYGTDTRRSDSVLYGSESLSESGSMHDPQSRQHPYSDGTYSHQQPAIHQSHSQSDYWRY